MIAQIALVLYLMNPSFKALIRNDKEPVVAPEAHSQLIYTTKSQPNSWLLSEIYFALYYYFSWMDDIHSKYIAFSIKMMMIKLKIKANLACNLNN